MGGAGASVRMKIHGSQREAEGHSGLPAPLWYCGAEQDAPRDSTHTTPEMHGLGGAGTHPRARNKEEKELFQGAASSTHGAWGRSSTLPCRAALKFLELASLQRRPRNRLHRLFCSGRRLGWEGGCRGGGPAQSGPGLPQSAEQRRSAAWGPGAGVEDSALGLAGSRGRKGGQQEMGRWSVSEREPSVLGFRGRGFRWRAIKQRFPNTSTASYSRK